MKVTKKIKRLKNLMEELKKRNVVVRIMTFLIMSIFLVGATVKQENVLQTGSDLGSKTENIANDDLNKEEVIGTSEMGKQYIYDAFEVSRKLKKYEYKNDGKKVAFLTFDDGVSLDMTPKILDILNENDVKATFFIVGKNIENGGEEAEKLLKREYDEGHAIGNHTYSHDYKLLFPKRILDLRAFKADYEKNSEVLKRVLGEKFSTRVLRCPGGYMSWKHMNELDCYLNDNNIAPIDWNALNGDAEGKKKDADELLRYTVKTSKGEEMVVLLMHDSSGKEETVKALPKIINYFKGLGYEFRTLG